jgi:hypothetical protein
MAVEPNSAVYIPSSIGGRKEVFRSFAEKLAECISGAVDYETPKLWNVAKAGKKLLNVLELLDRPAAVRNGDRGPQRRDETHFCSQLMIGAA